MDWLVSSLENNPDRQERRALALQIDEARQK
jgi:hypothetical protein